MKTLQEVREYLNSIPSINRGGCVIAALALQKWIEKNTGEQSNIVYCYNSWYSYVYEQNELALKTENTNPNSCTHAYLLYNGNYVASDEVISEEEVDTKYYKKHVFIHNDFVYVSLKNLYNWNPDFNRVHVKEIEAKLGIEINVDNLCGEYTQSSCA